MHSQDHEKRSKSAWLLSWVKSPIELRAELADARVARAGHLAELTAAKVPIRIIELGMIEDVEKFGAYFKRDGFFDSGSFRQAKIRVVESGSMEELTVRVAEITERPRCKRARQEEAPRVVEGGTIGVWLARIHLHDRAYKVGHVSATLADKGEIAALPELDRQPTGEARDPVYCPALCQPFRQAVELSPDRLC